MIPKIIHYCWLSNDSYPEMIQKCIESWHKHLKGYKFKLWNRYTFDINSVGWVKQAFEARKYAFAADYIRLYALYTEGGIYLDSDVLVYKNFNDLLSRPYFIGQDFVGAFEPAVIGAVPGLKWIKTIMDYYKDRDFINLDGTLNIKNLPVVFFERLISNYRFKSIDNPEEFDTSEDLINLYPQKFFNGRNNIKPVQFPESYCSHLFANSWSEHKTQNKFYRIIPKFVLNAFLGLYYHVLRKRKTHFYDPLYRQNNLK